MSRCRPFHVAGFNAYQLCEAAYTPPVASPANISSADAAGPRLPTSPQRKLVAGGMAHAAALGMNTVRTWAFTSRPSTPFQVRMNLPLRRPSYSPTCPSIFQVTCL